MKRLSVVLVVAGLIVACRDATDPGPATLNPAFDAAAGMSWSVLADMASPRSQHGALTGPDGRVYALEGLGPVGYVHASEAYDPASNAWSPIAASPGGWCCGGAARGGDDRLYVIGGEWESDGSMSRVSAYQVDANAWISVAPLTVERDVLAAATGPDGRIYAIGGAQEGIPRLTLASVEVYDPAENAWTDGVPMTQRRWFHAAVMGADGRIYVFGGLDFFDPLASAEVFDPATSQWSAIAPMPASRYAASAVASVDGLIYLVGGVVNNGGDGKSVIAYNPATDSWSEAPSLNFGHNQPAASRLADGRILATGGSDPDAGVLSSVEAFSTAPVPSNRAPLASAGADQTLACVAGGAEAGLDAAGSSDPDNDLLSYDWLEGPSLLATGAAPNVHLGLGAHLLTLRVTDDHGATAEDQVAVAVSDAAAPVIDLQRFTKTLWPADERLHLVARVKASDACQGTSLTVTVTSNQAPRKDWYHRHQKDWKVLPNHTGGFDVYVRAELESWRGDRVYNISAVSVDGSANRASAVTDVKVPRFRPRSWRH